MSRGGQRDPEQPVAEVGHRLDPAPVRAGDAPADRQTQPDAARARAGRPRAAHERREDPLGVVGRDARALIGDRDLQHRAAVQLGQLAHRDHAPALGREAGRVREEIHEDLLEPLRIARQRVGRGAELELELHAAVGEERPRRARRQLEHVVQPHELARAGQRLAAAGELEQVVAERADPLDRAARLAHVGPVLGLEQAIALAAQPAQVAAHDRHRGADLVLDHADLLAAERGVVGLRPGASGARWPDARPRARAGSRARGPGPARARPRSAAARSAGAGRSGRAGRSRPPARAPRAGGRRRRRRARRPRGRGARPREGPPAARRRNWPPRSGPPRPGRPPGRGPPAGPSTPLGRPGGKRGIGFHPDPLRQQLTQE